MGNICPECSHPIIDGNMPFCPKCGMKLPIISHEVLSPESQPVYSRWDVPSVNSDPSTVQQPPQPSLYIPPASTALATFSALAPEPRSKRSVVGWIIIVCVGILLLAILYVFIAGTMSIDNSKYCRDNFPGTYYSPSSKMCEHKVTQTPTPAPTLLQKNVTYTETKCWVNGYTRKDGTFVSGYFRSC